MTDKHNKYKVFNKETENISCCQTRITSLILSPVYDTTDVSTDDLYTYHKYTLQNNKYTYTESFIQKYQQVEEQTNTNGNMEKYYSKYVLKYVKYPSFIKMEHKNESITESTYYSKINNFEL